MRKIENPALRLLAIIAAMPVLLILLLAHRGGEWLDMHAGRAFDRLARYFDKDGDGKGSA